MCINFEIKSVFESYLFSNRGPCCYVLVWACVRLWALCVVSGSLDCQVRLSPRPLVDVAATSRYPVIRESVG